MALKKEWEKVLKDYKYIKDKYGSVYDECGGWCNCDVLWSMLKEPTYNNACNHLESWIVSVFVTGLDGKHGNRDILTVNKALRNDKMLKSIYDDYKHLL